MVAPTVLSGRSFAQDKPNSQLLFFWRAQDRSLRTVDRLSTGTLTRASAGGLTDGRGQRTANALTDVRLVGAAADNQPRWGVSTAGVPHLLLEDTRTNLMPISKPSTGWQISSALSTGAETTIAPDGTLVRLLTDNSTTVTQVMTQDVEVASTVALTTWYTKWNGSTFGAIHRLTFRDNSAAADRGRIIWNFGSTGTMTITSTGVGSVITAPTHIGNNWWKTTLETGSLSTGNDNQLEITPGQFPAGTTGGDMFISEIQVEDVTSTGLFASSHAPTVSAAVTRAAETLSFPFLPVPQEMTVYVKFIERGTILLTTDTRIMHIGSIAAGGDPRFAIDVNSGNYRVFHDNGITIPAATLAVAPSAGDTVELRAILHSDGHVTIGQCINGAGETTATDTTMATLGAAWAGQLLHLNSVGTSNVGFGFFEQTKISTRVLTLTQCREAF